MGARKRKASTASPIAWTCSSNKRARHEDAALAEPALAGWPKLTLLQVSRSNRQSLCGATTARPVGGRRMRREGARRRRAAATAATTTAATATIGSTGATAAATIGGARAKAARRRGPGVYEARVRAR